MECAQIGILTCSNSLLFLMHAPGQRAIPGACSQSVRDAKNAEPGALRRLPILAGPQDPAAPCARSGLRFHGPSSPPRRFFCGRNAEIAIPGFDRGAGSSENLDDAGEMLFSIFYLRAVR